MSIGMFERKASTMTPEKAHSLSMLFNEVPSVLRNNSPSCYGQDLTTSSLYLNSAWEPVRTEYDLGTILGDIPCLSTCDVTKFFTILESEEDGSCSSGHSSDSQNGGSASEAGWQSEASESVQSSSSSSNPGETTVTSRSPSRRKRHSNDNKQLWQFILETLDNDRYNPKLITWIDREAGVFKFTHSRRVAELWNQKHGGAKSFEHLSRSIRHYYKKGIMSRIPNKRLVYKFESNATDWVQLVKSSKPPVRAEM